MAGRITDHEVVELLNRLLHVKVSREQLAKPTKQFVLDIYARFLNEFGVENLNQPNLLACTAIDNYEQMEGAIPMLNVFIALRYYLSKVGIEDLSMADIVAPKRNRTIQLIGALCTFLVHVIKLKTFWLEMSETMMHIPQRRRELELKIIKMTHANEEKQMMLSSLKNKTLGMDKKAAELEEKLIRKKSETEKVTEESNAIKARTLEIREKLSEYDLKISTVKEETQKKSQEILRSPQKKISEANQLEEQLKTAKEEIPKLKAELNTLTSRSKLYETGSQMLQKSTDGLQDLLQLTANIIEKTEELKNFEVEYDEMKNEINSLEIQLKGVESSKQTLQAQISKETKKYQREKDILVELKTGLQKKLQGLESSSSHFQQEVMQRERTLLELDREISSVRQTEEATLKSIDEMVVANFLPGLQKLPQLAKQLDDNLDINI